jgi:carbonic anhydrase
MARGEVAPAARAPAALPPEPRRALVVLTCMDARIDPLAGFGLRLGDAHVLRNAGAEVTDDVLRSLQLSAASTGSRELWLVGHTSCVAHGGSDERVEASLYRSARRVAGADGLPEDYRVRAFCYDLRTGRMSELPLPKHDHEESQ